MAWHVVILNYYHLLTLHNPHPEEVGIRNLMLIFMVYLGLDERRKQSVKVKADCFTDRKRG